jgi:DNA mismatch repair protein MutL
MNNVIKLLPDHVANQIAAGEVVQRPASVVKELLENSIDAGASQITLVIEDAGKSLIQVIDNGCGIPEQDVRLAFERHATSKISTAEDLFKIRTMGFRGEALASIAAVSQVDCISKTKDDQVATHLSLEAGKVVHQTHIAANQGTILSVKNLFYNIPARRNFLKSAQVEQKHIYEEFIKIALAHPDKRLKLINNDTEVFHLLPGNLKQRIHSLFGQKTADNLLAINEETSFVQLGGYVTTPTVAKKIRGEQYFFINKRYVRNTYLHHAIMTAYEGLIGPELFPSYFIFIEIDPSEIDVNIHPTKTEVKFRDERTVYHLLKSAAKRALGISAVGHVLDFEQETSIQVPFDASKPPVVPTILVNADFNPFNPETYKSQGNTVKVPTIGTPKNWEELYKIAQKVEANTSSPDETDPLFGYDIPTQVISLSEDLVTELFQLYKKYIMYVRLEQAYLIHQQYAHERVLYESLKKSIKNRTVLSQQMLIPVKLEFSAREMDRILHFKTLLNSIGFDFEAIGKTEIALYGLPIELEAAHAEDIMRSLSLDESEWNGAEEVLYDFLCRKIAAGSAYKSGQKLTQTQMAQLVKNLFNLENPASGIRGKKTFALVRLSDFDKLFNS